MLATLSRLPVAKQISAPALFSVFRVSRVNWEIDLSVLSREPSRSRAIIHSFGDKLVCDGSGLFVLCIFIMLMDIVDKMDINPSFHHSITFITHFAWPLLYDALGSASYSITPTRPSRLSRILLRQYPLSYPLGTISVTRFVLYSRFPYALISRSIVSGGF